MSSPWSFRPDPGIRSLVLRYMERHKIGKTEALHALLARGLREDQNPQEPPSQQITEDHVL